MKGDFFLGMGTNPKVCFLGGMGRRSLVVSQSRKSGFAFFQDFCFFNGVGWGGWRKGVGTFCFCLIFFCDMVT
jgi:hypothetical protein